MIRLMKRKGLLISVCSSALVAGILTGIAEYLVAFDYVRSLPFVVYEFFDVVFWPFELLYYFDDRIFTPTTLHMIVANVAGWGLVGIPISFGISFLRRLKKGLLDGKHASANGIPN